MTKPPILRRLGNKLIATDELVARFDSAGIQLEDLQSRLEATEQISLKLDTRTEALASELQREQQALRAMVAQFNDQLKANEIHGIQLHERVEQLQEQLLAIRADLGQLPSYAQLNANLAALPDRFKQDCVDLLQYHVEHDQAPRLRPPIRPRKNEEPVIDKIAFLVHSKELLNHFSCIWDALPQDSFDVLLHGEADLPAGEAFALALPGLPYDGHTRQEAQVSISGVESSRRHLGRTVDQATGPGQRAFHVRCGKIRLEPLSWNALYDVILCFGPYHAGYFSRHTKATIVQIGYPRLDRYFTSPSDAAALSSSLGCAPDKKTVVWLPTHGAVSSLGHFNEEIAAPDRALQRAGQGASIDAPL